VQLAEALNGSFDGAEGFVLGNMIVKKYWPTDWASKSLASRTNSDWDRLAAFFQQYGGNTTTGPYGRRATGIPRPEQVTGRRLGVMVMPTTAPIPMSASRHLTERQHPPKSATRLHYYSTTALANSIRSRSRSAPTMPGRAT
jgi:hypothetical protein